MSKQKSTKGGSSSIKKTEEKKEPSEMQEPEQPDSPKPEETPDRQSQAEDNGSEQRRSEARPKNNTNASVRPFRMRLLPTVRSNPHRYKEYTPEPVVSNVSGEEAIPGGSGLGNALRNESGADKRGRVLESPENTNRTASHARVRKLKEMREIRRQKRIAALKLQASTSSSEISSIDSADLVSSDDGNAADSSSSEQEPPKRPKGRTADV